jgi:heme exporter protein A
MPGITIQAEGLTRKFGRRAVFQPVTFRAVPGEILAITGPNGAGKSTLLKLIAGVLSPSKGSCVWSRTTTKLQDEERDVARGFAAPYLELYDELTAVEHLILIANLSGKELSKESALEMLAMFGLQPEVARSDRRLRAYSSGMRQRVKLAIALINQPEVILFDEPTSNLDHMGAVLVFENLKQLSSEGRTIIIVTNDENERALATQVVEVEPIQ